MAACSEGDTHIDTETELQAVRALSASQHPASILESNTQLEVTAVASGIAQDCHSSPYRPPLEKPSPVKATIRLPRTGHAALPLHRMRLADRKRTGPLGSG
jgi:hypothetical protein